MHALLQPDLRQVQWPAFSPALLRIPLFASKVPAGFPSPAEEHVEARLDPTEYLVEQADATFFVTIQGQSMIEAGLMPGDKVVVDRSRTPAVGNIVLAVVDGEFLVRFLGGIQGKIPGKIAGKPALLPANPEFKPIEIKDGMQFEVWGVVTGSFRKFR